MGMPTEIDLRMMVREALREALGNRAGQGAMTAVEPVRIASDADLQALIARLAAPGGIEAVRDGRLRFGLASDGAASRASGSGAPAIAALPTNRSPATSITPATATVLDGVISERRLRGIELGSAVRLAPDAVLTPLAHDHLRRHGITVQRSAT